MLIRSQWMTKKGSPRRAAATWSDSSSSALIGHIRLWGTEDLSYLFFYNFIYKFVFEAIYKCKSCVMHLTPVSWDYRSARYGPWRNTSIWSELLREMKWDLPCWKLCGMHASHWKVISYTNSSESPSYYYPKGNGINTVGKVCIFHWHTLLRYEKKIDIFTQKLFSSICFRTHGDFNFSIWTSYF